MSTDSGLCHFENLIKIQHIFTSNDEQHGISYILYAAHSTSSVCCFIVDNRKRSASQKTIRLTLNIPVRPQG